MKRVFLAVSFHNNPILGQYINNIQSELLQEKIKWVAPENTHLTLKFFGPIDDKRIENIKKALKSTLENSSKLKISFNKLRLFGSRYQPRVLWLGMENSESIVNLESQIRNALVEIAIPYDRQNFVPHLTIARIKQLKSKKYFQSVIDKYSEFDSGIIEVDRIFLYQSILRPEGPIYKVLAEFKLK
jgi:2'-5' RNA ligase